jgi:hypothetical protein
LVPPPFLFDSWDRQGLIKHVLLQVHLTPPGAPSPSTGAPPGSLSTRAYSFASPSALAVVSGFARHGEQ